MTLSGIVHEYIVGGECDGTIMYGINIRHNTLYKDGRNDNRPHECEWSLIYYDFFIYNMYCHGDNTDTTKWPTRSEGTHDCHDNEYGMQLQ